MNEKHCLQWIKENIIPFDSIDSCTNSLWKIYKRYCREYYSENKAIEAKQFRDMLIKANHKIEVCDVRNIKVLKGFTYKNGTHYKYLTGQIKKEAINSDTRAQTDTVKRLLGFKTKFKQSKFTYKKDITNHCKCEYSDLIDKTNDFERSIRQIRNLRKNHSKN